MKLPQSERLIYKLISSSEEDIRLLTSLDANSKNKEHFPNGALLEKDIPIMVQRFLEGYKKYNTPIFMIFDKNANFIGRVGFGYAKELDSIEIGYVIDHMYWGKGYATEAVKTLLEWAKLNLKYKEIFALANIENMASIKVMQKVGMEYVDSRVLEKVKCDIYKKVLT
ncbi:GNAT family N-acetyltransferase [Francisella sp. 19X1-34]|uniref:GNAT family N-acetyltransferase n=1 Tax=Francisella sp. 19X1-34 TaxID=3087177 RepID=UPI002E34C67B|nr:GNAT family N-acetyltransferase [Francisella sp. 19X1-34]MED7789045.1 GNAT family N-acetyltransferase [Francisella sp. 19X1-34]